MTTSYTLYEIQLKDMVTNKVIETSGGKFIVLTDGTCQKEDIYDPDTEQAIAGTSQPVAMSRGRIRFKTLATVEQVDIWFIAPGGQVMQIDDVKGRGPTEVAVDTSRKLQNMRFPFYAGDYTAGAENDTGVDFPLYCAIAPNPGLYVIAIDATEDLDVGLLSSETAGDADGIMDGISIATAGRVKATRTNGSDTMGALLSVQDSANAGDLAPEPHVVTGSNAVSLTVTPSAGSDTGEAFLEIPFELA